MANGLFPAYFLSMILYPGTDLLHFHVTEKLYTSPRTELVVPVELIFIEQT